MDYIRRGQMMAEERKNNNSNKRLNSMPSAPDELLEKSEGTFAMEHRFQPLMFFGMNQNQMIVVERPLLKMLEGLPESFWRPKYGS